MAIVVDSMDPACFDHGQSLLKPIGDSDKENGGSRREYETAACKRLRSTTTFSDKRPTSSDPVKDVLLEEGELSDSPTLPTPTIDQRDKREKERKRNKEAPESCRRSSKELQSSRESDKGRRSESSRQRSRERRHAEGRMERSQRRDSPKSQNENARRSSPSRHRR